MFYGVHYQDIVPFEDVPEVYTAGFYLSIEKAINRLNEIVPNYKLQSNQTVISKNRIAWINTYDFNDDLNEKSFSCYSLHNPINLNTT